MVVMSQFYILDSFESRKEVERPFGHNTHGSKIGVSLFWRGGGIRPIYSTDNP